MKKQIKKLVVKSYKNNHLNPEIVDMIADHLSRKSLKQYIRLIKQEENKKRVMVTSPISLTHADKQKLQSHFPDKKIIYLLDPDMISGIRVIDRNTEFETSLSQVFNDIIRFLDE